MTQYEKHLWSYEKKRRADEKGRRWHFVSHYILLEGSQKGEGPFELYFRDDDRTEFGVLRFKRSKDNPLRNYETTVTKIMNDAAYRQTLLDRDTERIWLKSWK